MIRIAPTTITGIPQYHQRTLDPLPLEGAPVGAIDEQGWTARSMVPGVDVEVEAQLPAGAFTLTRGLAEFDADAESTSRRANESWDSSACITSVLEEEGDDVKLTEMTAEDERLEAERRERKVAKADVAVLLQI